ncbi:MAG: hypothetical protein ACRDUV_05025 [Pseudonocardiaceae bacterium]
MNESSSGLERGEIHITSDNPDAKDTFHTTLSNNEQSKRYHPTFYAQLARLLTEFGKSVPGWADAAES